MASLSNTGVAASATGFHLRNLKCLKWRVRASSSAAPEVDLTNLQSAVEKTSLRELTTLEIKNAENLAITGVRNDAAFLFTVVGTTGLLGVLAGQLPG